MNEIQQLEKQEHVGGKIKESPAIVDDVQSKGGTPHSVVALQK
jgi:hypothetical protein